MSTNPAQSRPTNLPRRCLSGILTDFKTTDNGNVSVTATKPVLIRRTLSTLYSDKLSIVEDVYDCISTFEVEPRTLAHGFA
ncbi:hypothetical protein N7516_001811 [Penicillium verrucosum]|uniref:uncharacterized protein n=1 Tax=Penicillium verrucosum TaxID=60171 RepID=UPI0025452EA0|nr:uncharacterized protein N7516_001811 [Penicillium verrucosum]KAJ5941643.1 hypothetical protein N7516_001811 [Penicillium verrucosum]